MPFGSGFLQGLQVGQQFEHKNELMRQRKVDRDREQYGRDVESLMNDWQNTKGDRTDEEFVNSPEFASLAKRHRGSKVFENAIQAGMEDGKVAKLRDIRQGPNGKNVLIVDTYDKEGRLISKGRPVTEGRTSREKDPKGKVSQFTNQELYEGMLGALQQSPDYVDRRGLADRFEAGVSALDPTGKSVTSNGTTTSTASPAGAEVEEEAQGGAQPSGAVTSPVETEPQDPTQPLPTQQEQVAAQQEQVAELEAQHNALRAQMDELETISAKHEGQMTREQYVAHRRELSQVSDELMATTAQLDELTGSSTARRMGASLSEVPGDFVRSAGEFGEAIADIPAVKGVTKAVGDFFGGLTSGEGTPPPEGTKATERFEHGADSQANAARKDKKGPFDPSNIKDRTRAQQNKINQVNERTALAVANNKKLSRKMMTDYRKALRAQVLHGDISVKDATSSYYAVLKATKSSDKYKLHLDSKNGTVFVINEADGSISRSKYASGDGAAESKKEQALYDDKQYKRLLTVGEIVTKGDEHAMADFMAAADMSRDTVGFAMTQPGSHALLDGAYQSWQHAINDEANWNPFVSTGDAARKNPSLSPYISARILGLNTVDNPQIVGDFAARLAYAKGGNKLTEADWLAVSQAAQALATNQGIVGEAAMEEIIRLYSEFNGQ